jgi:hypothetical protein
MPRRYGQRIQSYRTSLTEGTIAALAAMVPAGHRAEFIERAVRRALADRARALGAGDLPGERLQAIASWLDEITTQLRAHAARWGE